MLAETTSLLRLEDLEDASTTRTPSERDLEALRATADWIRTFVAKPHKDLGRSGAVCPFVDGARERKVLWLAPERVADRSVDDVVRLVRGYRKRLLDAQPDGGDNPNSATIVLVFSDLSADREKDLFDGVLQQLAASFYAQDGLVLGGFYERNEASAIYNPGFHPLRPPVPFLLMRHAVTSDWKFFLDQADWLDIWGRRFGEAAIQALAEELRRLPWRTMRG